MAIAGGPGQTIQCRPAPALLSTTPTAVGSRLAVGWLIALIASNAVAAAGLLGDIANHVSRGSGLSGSDFLSGWDLILYGAE